MARIDYDDLPEPEDACRACGGRHRSPPCGDCLGVKTRPTEFGRAVLDFLSRHPPTVTVVTPSPPPRVAAGAQVATGWYTTRGGRVAHVEGHFRFRDWTLSIGLVADTPTDPHVTPAVWYGDRCVSRDDPLWDLHSPFED